MDNVQPKAITSAELATYVLHHEPLFIVDVRNQTDFNEWKIEGKQVQIINKPYFELLDSVEDVLEEIPEDRQVLVVCAKEGSSRLVAQQLIEHGKSNLAFLAGGMKAWSDYLEPVKIGDLKSGGFLYQFVRLGKGCLSYMVISDGEAAVIDPVRLTEVFKDFAAKRQTTIVHTLDTHLHADHISGGRKLAEETGATYWLPPMDAGEVVFPYHPLEDGVEISVGKSRISIQPLYSPGHTIGSTSLVIDGEYLISGDILFVSSIGRPDLAGLAEDWVSDLRETLYQRYKELSDNLIVLPAHFGKVSELGDGGKVAARLGDLYLNNPGLNMASEIEFRRSVTKNLPPQPNAFQEIRQINMGKLNPEEEEQREMEIGPNRCAIHDK